MIIQDCSLLTHGDAPPPAVYLADALRFVSYVSSGIPSADDEGNDADGEGDNEEDGDEADHRNKHFVSSWNR